MYFISIILFLLFYLRDLIIGGLTYDYQSRTNEHTFTFPYYGDELTWCISSAKRIPAWLNIFTTFKNSYPFLLGVAVFICACIGFYFYSGVEGTDLDVYTIMLVFFSICLWMTPTYKPALSSTKLILFLASIAGGIFSLTYLSFYTTILTCPKYYAQNQFVDDLIEKNYRFSGPFDSLKELRKQYKVLKYKIKFYNRTLINLKYELVFRKAHQRLPHLREHE